MAGADWAQSAPQQLATGGACRSRPAEGIASCGSFGPAGGEIAPNEEKKAAEAFFIGDASGSENDEEKPCLDRKALLAELQRTEKVLLSKGLSKAAVAEHLSAIQKRIEDF